LICAPASTASLAAGSANSCRSCDSQYRLGAPLGLGGQLVAAQDRPRLRPVGIAADRLSRVPLFVGDGGIRLSAGFAERVSNSACCRLRSARVRMTSACTAPSPAAAAAILRSRLLDAGERPAQIRAS